jgi:hypothetical protein
MLLKYNILIWYLVALIGCHRTFNFLRHYLYNDHAEFQFSSVSALHETNTINSLEEVVSLCPLTCFTSETIALFSGTWSPVVRALRSWHYLSHTSLLCKKLKHNIIRIEALTTNKCNVAFWGHWPCLSRINFKFIPWWLDWYRKTLYIYICVALQKKKKKKTGFGPLANYADRATGASWRSSANFCG